YPYGSPSEMTEELTAMMAKPVGERTAEEAKLVNAYEAQTAPAISQLDIPDSRLYAIAFSADGERLALGGSDGSVRIMAVHSGEQLAAFVPVALSQPADAAATEQHVSVGSGLPASPASMPASDSAELELLPPG